MIRILAGAIVALTITHYRRVSQSNSFVIDSDKLLQLPEELVKKGEYLTTPSYYELNYDEKLGLAQEYVLDLVQPYMTGGQAEYVRQVLSATLLGVGLHDELSANTQEGCHESKGSGLTESPGSVNPPIRPIRKTTYGEHDIERAKRVTLHHTKSQRRPGNTTT